jgi:hypothetical protein
MNCLSEKIFQYQIQFQWLSLRRRPGFGGLMPSPKIFINPGSSLFSKDKAMVPVNPGLLKAYFKMAVRPGGKGMGSRKSPGSAVQV